MAAPSGQLLSMPNWVATALPIIIPLMPPTSSGVTKSPAESRKMKLKAATTPGALSGSVTCQKVLSGLAPRSEAASRTSRSMFSRAEKIGSVAKGM